jgi:hypothetical protein
MSGSSVGPVRLGMSQAQVEATGVVVVTSHKHPGCWNYLDGHRGVVQVMGGRHGVNQIWVYTFIHTPEGAAVGDTYAQLRARYPDAIPATPNAPDAQSGQNDYRVPVLGQSGVWYLFSFGSQDEGRPIGLSTRMVELSLVNGDHSCG